MTNSHTLATDGTQTRASLIPLRWAAIGAAVALTLGAACLSFAHPASDSDATVFVPIEPCRLADTRAGESHVGPRDSPIGARETLGILAAGDNGMCTGIPAWAERLELNVTMVNATSSSFLMVWGKGARPLKGSNLHPSRGQAPTSIAVTTGITVGGGINIFNHAGTVDVVVDVAGYYTSAPMKEMAADLAAANADIAELKSTAARLNAAQPSRL